MNPEVQTQRRAAGPRAAAGWTIWSRRYGRLVAVRRRSGAEERALSQDRAPRGGGPRRRRAGGGRVHRGAGRVAARPRGGQRARAALPAPRRLPRTWSKLLLRKAEIVDDVAEKKTLYFRAAQLHEEVLEDLESAVGVFQHVLSVDDGDKAALDQLERLYIRLGALERSQGRLRQEGGAGDDAGREEADAVRARSGLRPRARRSGARDRDLQLDHGPRSRGLRRRPGARSAVSAARALVRPARGARAPDRAGAVAGRGRVAALPHRRAVARAPEGSGARRRGVPRRSWRSIRSHEPTLARAGRADGRQGRAGAGGRGARADLRERRRVGSRDRGLRGDGGAQRRCGPQTVELLSRIAEIEERRLSHQNAAFDVYGRALRVDPSNQDVLAHLERLADETGHWAKLATLLRRRDREGRRSAPRRSTCCCASRASTRRRPASSSEAIATYRRVVDAEPDNKDGARRARSAVSAAPSSGTSWPTSSAARSGSRRPTRTIVALNFRLAQIYELALVDMPKAVEAYREILTADPTHAETRAALERMFMGGTMQLEIADVLEPLYRVGRGVGEAAPDLRGAARPA